MKPEPKKEFDDVFLNALLDGQSVADFAHAHPSHAKEFEAYAEMLATLAMVKKENPSVDGLHRALATLQTKEVSRAVVSPYSFITFITTYRTAAVLPLFVIALAASGWFLLPKHAAAPGGNTEVATSQAIMNDAVQTGAPSTQSKKMAFAEAPTTPADPALTDVFSNEMNRDSNASAPSNTGTTSSSSDAQDVAAFSDVYDPNEL